jgi:hypothetical protein
MPQVVHIWTVLEGVLLWTLQGHTPAAGPALALAYGAVGVHEIAIQACGQHHTVWQQVKPCHTLVCVH